MYSHVFTGGEDLLDGIHVVKLDGTPHSLGCFGELTVDGHRCTDQVGVFWLGYVWHTTAREIIFSNYDQIQVTETYENM